MSESRPPAPPPVDAAPEAAAEDVPVEAEIDREEIEAEELGDQLSHLGRRLLVSLALALVVIAALALYADGRELLRHLGDFDPALLVPILALSLVNYALRFWRWHVYLRRVGSDLGVLDSLWVFLFGFVLTVTPGKLGELGKAWLVRELGGGRARRGIAAVLAERLADIVGVVALACWGSLAFTRLAPFAWGGLVVTLGLTALLAWPRFMEAAAALVARIPLLRERAQVLLDVQASLGVLLRPGMLTFGLVISVVAWGAEGLGFALVVSSYTGETAWLAGVFNYSISSMAGGIAMLPGGLVAVEGALTALLAAQGLGAAAAASATLIARAATLWFAFFLGLAAVPPLWHRMRRHRAGAREVE